MFNTFVGVDISKDSFDIAIIQHKKVYLKHKHLQMNKEDFTQFLSILNKFKSKFTLIIMEATGCYHHNLRNFLINNNYKVAVINAYLIKCFISSESLRKTKTDKKDAFAIAKYGLEKSNNLSISNSIKYESLKIMIRERERLNKDRSKLKVKIKSFIQVVFPELNTLFSNPFSSAIIDLLKIAPSANKVRKLGVDKVKELVDKRNLHKSYLDIYNAALESIAKPDIVIEETLLTYLNLVNFYSKEIKNLDEKIESFCVNIPQLNKNALIISSIPGIKYLSAIELLAESRVFDNNIYDVFSDYKKLIAYFGTDPSTRISGTSIRGKGNISKRGNPFLRKKGFILAFCVSQNTSKYNDYYNKKRNEGKTHKQAVIAVLNKVIKLIYFMIKNQKMYDENYSVKTNGLTVA